MQTIPLHFPNSCTDVLDVGKSAQLAIIQYYSIKFIERKVALMKTLIISFASILVLVGVFTSSNLAQASTQMNPKSQFVVS